MNVLEFTLPPALEAHEPPEADGRTRDDVRLLVSPGVGEPVHATFSDLPQFLRAGDLVVVNTSATMPASVVAHRANGDELELHISTRLENGAWLVEPRTHGRTGKHPVRGRPRPRRDAPATRRRPAWRCAVATATRRACGWPTSSPASRSPPTWRGTGSAIRYSYVEHDWPIDAYQTVYATEPGSAEMPSAGRPITRALITRLVADGVGVTPLLLHTGVSSLENHESPYPEYFRVPEVTAHRVNDAHATGGRVIAVGTTVVRALESAADATGRVHAADGWTDLVISPERGVHAVDGLLTGWHEPQASHLLMLEAIAGRDVLSRAYRAALARGVPVARVRRPTSDPALMVIAANA